MMVRFKNCSVPSIYILVYFFIHSYAAEDANEIDMDTVEITRNEGYGGEYHDVVTEDGYILTMHRIPSSPKSPAAPNKPVVFIQHGNMGSSFSWIALGPNISLGYLLADEGYDVWLGNYRGNIYSRKHVKLSPDDDAFWNFSFHEMGVYDLSAVFDYILNVTQQKTLFYNGYSLGTTMFFVLISERPEYNDKINLMVAEAPAALVRANSGSPLTTPPVLLLGKLLYSLGLKVLKPDEKPQAFLAKLCSNVFTNFICNFIVFAQNGFNPEWLNVDNLGSRISHISGGVSMKMVNHLIQLIDSGKFQKFDYGITENMKRYNKMTPPEYNLAAVTIPVALFYAMSDEFVNPRDVLWLNRTLPNSIAVYRVPRQTFSHSSFVYAPDSRTLVNNKIVDLFDSY